MGRLVHTDSQIAEMYVRAVFKGNFSWADSIASMLPRVDVDSFMIRSPRGKNSETFSASGEICA